MAPHVFLTEREKDYFSSYSTPKHSQSFTQRYLYDFLFSSLSTYVPEDVSPNVLALASALCLVQAWYVVENYATNFPALSISFAAACVSAWFALDSVDEIHAKRIHNDTTFAELFDHVCSTLGSIFLLLTLCGAFFNEKDFHKTWYVVEIGQLVLLNKHVQSLGRGKITYGRTRGPGEVVTVVVCALVLKALVLGPNKFDEWMETLDINAIIPNVFNKYGHTPAHFSLLALLHFSLNLHFLRQTVITLKEAKHSKTRRLLRLCIGILYLPAIMETISRYLHGPNLNAYSQASVVASALTLAMLTCDVVLCRMADRSLHYLMPIICMISVVSVPLTYAVTFLYFGTLFFELSMYLRMPILSVMRNVYVDGIFDMCHIGHLKHFARAAQLGTRLFVGVVNDEDATPYKRKPIMTHDERCEMVAASKSVYKVIPNAPCVPGGLNEEFLRKHNIHIVGCGEEYEKPDDVWYFIPRRLKMTRVLPRTIGMSTTDLIERIRKRAEKSNVNDIMS